MVESEATFSDDVVSRLSHCFQRNHAASVSKTKGISHFKTEPLSLSSGFGGKWVCPALVIREVDSSSDVLILDGAGCSNLFSRPNADADKPVGIIEAAADFWLFNSVEISDLSMF